MLKYLCPEALIGNAHSDKPALLCGTERIMHSQGLEGKRPCGLKNVCHLPQAKSLLSSTYTQGSILPTQAGKEVEVYILVPMIPSGQPT